MFFKEKDITTWNGVRFSSNFRFSIEKFNDSMFSEDDAICLEYFLTDEKHIFADQFNIEYMGFLTGEVNCDKEQLIEYINNFLRTYRK